MTAVLAPDVDLRPWAADDLPLDHRPSGRLGGVGQRPGSVEAGRAPLAARIRVGCPRAVRLVAREVRRQDLACHHGLFGHIRASRDREYLAEGPDQLTSLDIVDLNGAFAGKPVNELAVEAILDAIEKMAQVTRRKLSAQPNAGMPRDIGGRSMYMASPEYMASYARHLIHAGAKVLGGCCGTTPDHIKAVAQGVRPLAPRHPGSGGRGAGGDGGRDRGLDDETAGTRIDVGEFRHVRGSLRYWFTAR